MTLRSKITLDKKMVFLIGFSLYLIQSFLQTTMYIKVIPSTIFRLIRLVSIALVMMKIMTDKYSINQLAIIFITLILFGFSLIESTYSILLEYTILIIGAKDISFNRIVKVFFKVELILLIITIISSNIGIIEDLVYIRSKNNKYRHSFGVGYPTDFVAHIFFLCLAYVYIKGKNIKWYNNIIICLIAIVTYYFCDTRLDSILIFVITIISLLYKYNKINFKNVFVKYGLVFAFLICEVVSIYLSINYDSTNEVYVQMNKLLSSRLRIGNMMYNDYGVNLFGQYIDDHGAGGSVVFQYDEYNYIDCSYLRILLKYGLLISIIITIINIFMAKKLYKTQNYYLLLLSLLISVNSMIAQHYIDFSYNFLLLVYLSKLDDNINTISESKDNNEKTDILKRIGKKR